MFKTHSDSVIRILGFGFVSDFEFRALDFLGLNAHYFLRPDKYVCSRNGCNNSSKGSTSKRNESWP